jgi:hypothetical protein
MSHLMEDFVVTDGAARFPRGEPAEPRGRAAARLAGGLLGS